ncbi:MAG TPA: hypothetical protein VJR27_00595 [Candidatus Saccharimonadales bacterium]|nr:hypothetical protein [Candidatus Saccharimonadales bacterium]
MTEQAPRTTESSLPRPQVGSELTQTAGKLVVGETTQESRKFDPRRVRYSYVWNRERGEDDRVAAVSFEHLEVFAGELDRDAYDAAMETWKANPQGAEPRRQSFRRSSDVASNLTRGLTRIVEDQKTWTAMKSFTFAPPAHLSAWKPFLIKDEYGTAIRAEELPAVADGLVSQQLPLERPDAVHATSPEDLQAFASLLHQYQTVLYQD